jgi:hypothetical protein
MARASPAPRAKGRSLSIFNSQFSTCSAEGCFLIPLANKKGAVPKNAPFVIQSQSGQNVYSVLPPPLVPQVPLLPIL